MMPGARRAHIHRPIYNRLGGAKLGEAYRVPPGAGHRVPSADVLLGQDTSVLPRK